jgi:hypothetical protein
MRILVIDANGAVVGSETTRTYPAKYFEQITVSDFTGVPAASIPANGLLRVQFFGGRGIVYGAYTDNKTNDGAIRFLSTY